MNSDIRYKVEAADGFVHSYSNQIPRAIEYAKDCAEFEKGKIFQCEVDILGHEGPPQLIFDYSAVK